MLARHLRDKVADGYGPQRALQSMWPSSWQPSSVWLVTGREAHKDPLAAAASRRLLYPPALSLLYCHTTCVPACLRVCVPAHLHIHTNNSLPARHPHTAKLDNPCPSSPYRPGPRVHLPSPSTLALASGQAPPVCSAAGPRATHSRPATVAQPQAFPRISPALHHTNNRWAWRPTPMT